MMGRYKWLKEGCTTEYMSTVSAGVPMILLFLKRSSKKFEKKSDCSKTFGFFLNKLSLECRELTWSLTRLKAGLIQLNTVYPKFHLKRNKDKWDKRKWLKKSWDWETTPDFRKFCKSLNFQFQTLIHSRMPYYYLIPCFRWQRCMRMYSRIKITWELN